MNSRAPRLDRERMERAVAEFLAATGDDPARRALQRTPERVAAAAVELLGGIGVDPVPMLREGWIPVDGGEAAASDRPAAAGGARAATSPATGGDADVDAHRVATGADADVDVDAPIDDPAPDAPPAPTGSPDQPVIVRGASFRSICEHHLLPVTGTVHVAYVPSHSIVGLGRIYELVEIVTTRLTLQERIGDEIVDGLMAGLDARGALAVIAANHGCVGLRGSRQERGETVTVSARGTLADAAGRAEIMALLGATSAAGSVAPTRHAAGSNTEVRLDHEGPNPDLAFDAG